MGDTQQLVSLEASAGSGKTYSLAIRYIYLLFEGARVEEILTLTFTKKAVKEMSERIGKFLEVLADKSNPQRAELIENLHKNYSLKSEVIEKNAQKLLKNFYLSLPKIMTIDAFFNSIVKRFCWYMGIPHNFSLQNLDEEEIYEHFLSSLQDSQKDFLLNLSLSHHRPISNILSLIDKVNTNYPNSFKPHIEGNLNEIKEQVLHEAHKIAQEVLNHPLATDYAKKCTLFHDFNDLLGKTWVWQQEEYRYYKKLNFSPTLFESLNAKLKEYFLIQESIFLRFIEQFCFLFDLSKNTAIKKNNALSFSDITQKCYNLLCQEDFSSDFFYFRLDEKISHILLDEFQDTSVLQYKILYPLIAEICSGKGRIGERSFFVVGDKKQSIYSFRGGEGRLMGDVKNNFSLKENALDTNYRSEQVIVEFVNQVFGNCMGDYFKQNAIKKGGYVKIFSPIIFEKEADNKSLAFSQIHSTIENLLQKGVSLDEIAILCFNNQEVLEVGDFLKKHYEHITTEESITLDKKRDAQILLNALAYARNPQDSLARHNLSKLLGKSYLEIPECVAWNGESVEEFIYKSIKLYSLNSLEAQKVLEIACESKNIEEFLEATANFNSLEEEKQGLRILTIHKSKGLEFPHLIVLDRMSKGGSGGDPLFCHYDENLKGSLFYQSEKRKIVDEIYAYVAEIKTEKEKQEKKNVIYVALTRAVKSLWIMPFFPVSAKSEFVNIGIVDEEGDLLIESEYGKLRISPSPQTQKTSPTLKVITQKDFGRQESFIKHKENIYKPNHIPSIKKGEAFHKALELFLGYQCSLEKIKQYLKNHYGIYLSSEEKNKILESLQKISLLFVQKFHFNELKTEISFMVEDKLYRIDCLLLCKDEHQNVKKAIVIDYKSGNESKIYEEQVKHYANFVKIQYPQAEIESYLMYQHNLELHQV